MEYIPGSVTNLRQDKQYITHMEVWLSKSLLFLEYPQDAGFSRGNQQGLQHELRGGPRVRLIRFYEW